jgi:cell division protein FtsI/penicillin-binding protein 2
LQPKGNTWEEAVSIGCPGAVAALGRSLGSDQVQAFYRKLGLFRAPSLRLPADSAALPTQAVNANQAALGENMQVSPLQMALAAAALSADGVRPAPLLVAAVNIPTTGWVPLQPLGEPEQALQADAAALTTQNLDGVQNDTWQSLAVAPNGPGHTVTWFLGGTTANWEHTPLTLVVLLEQSDPSLAAQIGQTVLQEALLGSTP